MDNTKICTKCKKELPLDKFAKYKRSKNGLAACCKDCMNTLSRISYAKNAKQYPKDRNVISNTKICTKCKKELPLDKFGKQRQHKDGLASWCKACKNPLNKIKSKEYREKKKANEPPENKKAISNTKVCTKCKKELSLDKFNKKKENKNGLTAICKDCSRAKRRKYDTTHKKEILQYRERRHKWKSENKDKVNVTTHKRRAKLRLLTSDLTVLQWLQIKIDFNNCCCYCGREIPLALEMDHFISLNAGGGFTKTNIVPACRSCNSSKGPKEIGRASCRERVS